VDIHFGVRGVDKKWIFMDKGEDLSKSANNLWTSFMDSPILLEESKIKVLENYNKGA